MCVAFSRFQGKKFPILLYDIVSIVVSTLGISAGYYRCRDVFIYFTCCSNFEMEIDLVFATRTSTTS